MNISGRRRFLNLYMKIATEFLYISGNLRIENLVQNGRVDDLLGVFDMIRRAIFWFRKMGHKVESEALPQERLQ